MRSRNSKRLIIDTDVAQASGDEDATDPRAVNCRDFLKGVMTQNHRIVMTRKISDEWKRHQSRFALEWRASMDARRRVGLFSFKNYQLMGVTQGLYCRLG